MVDHLSLSKKIKNKKKKRNEKGEKTEKRKEKSYSTLWRLSQVKITQGREGKSIYHRHVPPNVTNSVMITDSHYIFVHNWGELHENKVNLKRASCLQPWTQGNRCPFIWYSKPLKTVRTTTIIAIKLLNKKHLKKWMCQQSTSSSYC